MFKWSDDLKYAWPVFQRHILTVMAAKIMSSQQQLLYIFCSRVLQCEVLTVYLEANFGIEEWKLLSFTEYKVLPSFSLPNSYKLGAGKRFSTSCILDVFIMPELLKLKRPRKISIRVEEVSGIECRSNIQH